MTSHASFLQAARSCFGFLTSDFGFALVEVGDEAAGAWLTYERGRRRVIVSFEPGSGSWLQLDDLQKSEGSLISRKSYDFDRLLRDRGLSVPTVTSETAERLGSYASVLKEHFGDFLRGEPLPD